MFITHRQLHPLLRDLDPLYPTSTHLTQKCYACGRPLDLFRLQADHCHTRNLCSLCICYKKALPLSCLIKQRLLDHLPMEVQYVIHSFVHQQKDLLYGGYQKKILSIQRNTHKHLWSRILLAGMRPLGNTYDARNLMMFSTWPFAQTQHPTNTTLTIYDTVHTFAGPFGLAVPYVFHPNKFWNLRFTRSVGPSGDWGDGLVPARPF